MRVQVNDQIVVNAPAREVWRVLAHEFDRIDQWSSGVDKSSNIQDMMVPEGATVGGRVCFSGGFFGDAQEAFTHYDEESMRFGYKAIGEMPRFINHGGNNWSVQSLEPKKSVVAFSAEMDMQFFPGVLLLPLMPILKKILGTRTLEELKHYVEHGEPHPRKRRKQ